MVPSTPWARQPAPRASYPPTGTQRFTRAFYGRGAIQVEFIATMGDRIPGTSGAAIAEQLLGSVPASLVSRPTRRRYPVIAIRMPWTLPAHSTCTAAGGRRDPVVVGTDQRERPRT